ncbi:MAG TPA: hypothetical protein VHO25_20515, partial [Polyangiaceae bacterium]|nr:hypothetical protein [Polyangiaceae bacterium]
MQRILVLLSCLLASCSGPLDTADTSTNAGSGTAGANAGGSSANGSSGNTATAGDGPGSAGNTSDPLPDGGGAAGFTSNPSSDAGVAAGCDVVALLQSSCSGMGCHEGAVPAAALDLVTEGVEARLVDVPSNSCADWNLVTAGSAEQSLLYQKVALDMPQCGLRMPVA